MMGLNPFLALSKSQSSKGCPILWEIKEFFQALTSTKVSIFLEERPNPKLISMHRLTFGVSVLLEESLTLLSKD